MFKLKSKNEKIRQMAYRAIFAEFNTLTQYLPKIKRMEPSLINIIPLLSEYYNCNIVVHETRGVDCIVYCQPDGKNYRHKWPRIGKSKLLLKISPLDGACL